MGHRLNWCVSWCPWADGCPMKQTPNHPGINNIDRNVTHIQNPFTSRDAFSLISLALLVQVHGERSSKCGFRLANCFSTTLDLIGLLDEAINERAAEA